MILLCVCLGLGVAFCFQCLEEVLEAVDAVWGGRQPGVRAALGLCGGVEAR